MSDHQPPTCRTRYLLTRDNFIQRMKKLLCDLSSQASAVREQPKQCETPPPGDQQPPTKRA